MKDSLKYTLSNLPVVSSGIKDFLFLHIIEMGVLILISALILNLLLRLKWTKNFITSVIDDTLKVYDPESKCRRFSGTKMTMFAAFGSTLWSFHYDTISNGKANETLFLIMAGIATGVGITKAFSKKLDPTIVAPGVETTIKQENTANTSETTIKEEPIG